jgi:hypothetical protein
MKLDLARIAKVAGLWLSLACAGAVSGTQQPSSRNIPGEIQELLRALQSTTPEVHQQAASKLASLGERALPAVPDLIHLMGMGTLSWDGVDSQGRMTGGSFAYGESAEMILVKIGKPVVEPLLKYLGQRPDAGSPRASAAAEGVIHVLGKLQDERAVDPIMQCFRDKSNDVQAAAMNALLEFKSPAVADRLAEALKSKSGSMREGAAWVLIRKRDARVFPLIQKRLASPYYDQRLDAVRDLAVFGGPRAIQSLTTCMKKDPDPRVRDAAAEALKTLEPK